MNSSVTIRLPELAITAENKKEKEKVCGALVAPLDEGSGVSDEILLSRICEGNKEALSLLFRRHARVVRGVAYRVLRDVSEADDLLQDIFLLVDRLCKSYDGAKRSSKVLDSPNGPPSRDFAPALSDIASFLHAPGSGPGRESTG